jgi:SOS-response transcriptional repressor LexA
MTAYALTPQQRRLLDFLVSYQSAHGRAASFADMEAGLGVRSRYTLTRLMHGLRARGYVDWVPRAARSIVVTQQPTFTLPPATLAKLTAFCRAARDDPASVVADAVALHLDELAKETA